MGTTAYAVNEGRGRLSDGFWFWVDDHWGFLIKNGFDFHKEKSVIDWDDERGFYLTKENCDLVYNRCINKMNFWKHNLDELGLDQKHMDSLESWIKELDLGRENYCICLW